MKNANDNEQGKQTLGCMTFFKPYDAMSEWEREALLKVINVNRLVKSIHDAQMSAKRASLRLRQTLYKIITSNEMGAGTFEEYEAIEQELNKRAIWSMEWRTKLYGYPFGGLE